MSRYEIYSPEGLRVDGRRYNELRYFKCALGTHAHAADGSAMVEMGTSQVVCTVKGPQEPQQRSSMDTKKAVLRVNVHVAPFSSITRTKHTSNEKQLQELSMNLEETFADVVLAHLAPHTEIIVDLHVLAQDGNIMAGCVNAMCLGLIDAGVPMLDFIASVGVALADSVPLLDPNHIECSELPNLTVGVTGKSNKASLVIAEKRILLDRIKPSLDLAIMGCKTVHDIMDEQVRIRLNSLEDRIKR